MVDTVPKAIEKFIGGLPRQIQDIVLGSNPTTLACAIRLSATLTDNHVKAGTLTRKGAKKTTEAATTEPAKPESSFNPRKRKGKVFAVTTTAPAPAV